MKIRRKIIRNIIKYYKYKNIINIINIERLLEAIRRFEAVRGCARQSNDFLC